MNTQYLRYFETIARLGSYTEAAHELYVAQSSLTYGIKALEQELGAPLLVSSKRGAKLTEFGRMYLNYAHKALAALDEGQEGIDAMLGGMQHIDISVIEPMSIVQVPDLLREFTSNEVWAGVDFDLQYVTSSEVAVHVADGRTDIGFAGAETLDRHPELDFVPLAYDRVFFIVPEDHPLASREVVYLEDIVAYSYLGWKERTGMADLLHQRFLKELGAEPDAVMKCEQSFQVVGLVGAGFGVAFCPEIPFMDSVPLKKIDVGGEFWARTYGLIYRKDERYSPAVAALISLVKRRAADVVAVYEHRV